MTQSLQTETLIDRDSNDPCLVSQERLIDRDSKDPCLNFQERLIDRDSKDLCLVSQERLIDRDSEEPCLISQERLIDRDSKDPSLVSQENTRIRTGFLHPLGGPRDSKQGSASARYIAVRAVRVRVVFIRRRRASYNFPHFSNALLFFIVSSSSVLSTRICRLGLCAR